MHRSSQWRFQDRHVAVCQQAGSDLAAFTESSKKERSLLPHKYVLTNRARNLPK